jgi:hypothetical protein
MALAAESKTATAQAVVTKLQSAPAPIKVQGVDPESIKALNKMGAYLRSLNTFEVALDTTTDAVLDDGEKVKLSGVTNYKVRRPNALLVTMASDRKVRTIYYDGKSLTVYAPRVHYYATVSAPPTIKETLQRAYDNYGVELPLEDLFRWGTPDDKRNDLKAGTVIGYAKIDGKDTDQFAFRQGDIDWQVWIQRGDKPLPVKVVLTTTSDPASPEFSSVMRWNTNANFSDAVFAFKPPADAKPIKIVSQNP